jgi:oligopeptide transport system substrate-binding protein
MRGALRAKWVATAGVVALAATACGGSGGSGGSDDNAAIDPNGIVSYETGEPENPLQPADTQESYGHSVIKALFTGLVDYTPGTGKIVNMNAQSVTPSQNNKVWTVKLKPGWKFTNGETVTAKSYVDAWNWDANTKNNQLDSSWFADVQGYSDVHPAKGSPKSTTMSGLKVVDDNTFTITLSAPIPYYQYKLGYQAFDPLPSAFYQDPKGFGEKPVGNGPYKFVSWDHKKQIVVTRNKAYTGPNKAKNGGVVFKNYATEDAAYNDLLSNNVDIIRQVSNNNLANYKQDLGSRAIDQPISAIQTINPAYYTKQWKNIDIRVIQGLSMAIDRATITKTVLQNTREPADGWVAKGVLGFKAGACGQYCTYNPTKAKQLIKAGGGVPGNKIEIQYNTDGGHKPWVDAVCNSIRQAVGVQCTGDAKPDFQTDTEARDSHQVKSFYRSGWVLDYPFNGNFLRDLYGTGVAGNQGGFSDPKFDQLTKAADNAKTLDASAKDYQAAEAELKNSFPSIPLFYYRVEAGYSQNVSNVKFDQSGDAIVTDVTVKKK